MTAWNLYPDWMNESSDDVSPLPYMQPSKLPLPRWFDPEKWPSLASSDLINGVYRCQRCGMCCKTKNCAVIRKNLSLGIYTPRSIIAVVRALVEERLPIAELPDWFMKATTECNCCGRCSDVCIANVAFREGMSPEPNIDHKKLFNAVKRLLSLYGSD